MSLEWYEHQFGAHTAPTTDGHYVVQPDHIIHNGVRTHTRYSARRIRRRQPALWLGYHQTVTDAKQICELNDRSRWDEDIEAGAI